MNRISFLFFLFFFLNFSVQASVVHTLITGAVEDVLFATSCKQYEKSSCKVIPEFLKTQKNLCDIHRAAAQCEKVEKGNPADSWKYIRCDYDSLCFQRNVEIKDALVACIVGATSIHVSLAEMAKSYVSGTADRIAKNSEWLKECDQSLDCKRTLAQGQPSTAHLTDQQLSKKNTAAYLWSKKLEYDPIRVQQVIRGVITKEEYYRQIGWNPDAHPKAPKLAAGEALSMRMLWESITSKIEKDLAEVRCYIPVEAARLKCQILWDVLSGVGLERAVASRFAATGEQIAKEGAKEAERRMATRLTRIAEASEPKKALVLGFAQRNLTSKVENDQWLKFISKPTASQRNLTIENSMLKKMNDQIFKDEEYVTALTNAYKEVQFGKLKALEKEIQIKNPDFKFHTFSDYKSLRMAYDDIPGLNISGQLKKLTEETNIEFANFAIKNKLVREADEPITWFKASVGTTDDWSNLAAKYARQGHQKSMFVDGVNDPGFKKWVQNEFSQGQKLREEVLQSFKETSMLTSKNLKEANLSRDVFEILRKNRDDPAVAKSLLESKYGLQSIPDVSFVKLNQYFDKVDSFSPGLRNTERQFATLSDAPHGGISVDMIGLGADHLQRTSAQAFTKSTNVEDFLTKARFEEELLTVDIFKRKSEIEKKFKTITADPSAKVVCSGDGCKAFLADRALTENEIKRFANAVTEGGEQGRLRFSEVRGISKDYQDLVAKQGEDLEKKLRQKLNGQVDTRRLEGVNFSVLINATKPGDGTARLHISEASGLKLSPAEKKLIEENYKKVLNESSMGYK